MQHCARILFYICVASLYFTRSAALNEKSCRDLTVDSYCHCSALPARRYEIQCPPPEFSAKFNIRIRADNQIQFECDHIDQREYQLLPRMALGQVPLLRFRYCPLPGRAPIAQILQQLGITEVKYLMFEQGDVGAQMKRRHLCQMDALQHLRLSGNGLTQLPSDLFADVRQLVWLDLRANKLTLTEALFETLEQLRFLELGHNNLTSLPNGIFKRQHKLEQLNLWGNRLRNLTSADFEHTTALAALDLSANGIETFDANIFAPLARLSSIYMNANDIHTLPAALFARNKNLSEFRLIHNRVALHTLPAGLFANLPQLKDVRLTCGLEVLPADLFANSSRLANLTIKENMLRALPANLFNDQHSLHDLDLSHNLLESLSDELFQSTISLAELRLSYNRLTQITNELFATLAKLELLHIDHNNLKHIDAYAFRYSSNLQQLSLAHNQLTLDATGSHKARNTNSPFRYLYKLQRLDLHNNSLAHIFADWRTQLLELRELDLSYNNVTVFHNHDLQFLSKHGVHLNLTHNRIHEINFRTIKSMKMSQKPRPIHVDLNDNPLYCDCLLLHFLQYLMGAYTNKFDNKFTLRLNKLQCTGPTPVRGKWVRKLEYGELVCSLDGDIATKTRCPAGCACWMRPLDFMLLVNCSNANLTRIPSLPYETLLNGIELYVDHNNITTLPLNDDKGYASVRRIHAAHNRIRNVVIENLPAGLQFLDLRHNLVEQLNTTLLRELNNRSNIQGLLLAHNPWNCDCATKPLLEYTQNPITLQKLTVRDFNAMRCAAHAQESPQESYFKDLTAIKLCPNEMSLIIACGIGIALIGLLMGIVLALSCKYRQQIKVYLYAHNCCLWLVTEAELDKEKQYDAFVSYSHKDQQFIANYLVPQLEHSAIPFKLCVHERDFIVGECISEQIVHAVSNSRRTIVVLSQNFIESVWTRMEFRAAHQAALNERRSRVIVIIYSDIGDIENLESDLRTYLKTNTYLKWGDPYFWQKLRYALPHRSSRIQDQQQKLKCPFGKLEFVMP